MNLSFAKLSKGWKGQDARDSGEQSEQDGVNILHHRNKRKWDECTCRRCMGYRYQRGIRALASNLGREPTQQEVAQLWDRIQNDAGVA
jgi:hypothetical protein